ncbi:shock factor protein [Seminavis robusta]|uniref:Shock factor protein n=1 Tax=Seminavis robusta TaxID=568900 RepID=A0A9N8DAJ2_9STRA|nr:shock factor protein [Seminavis robusta]|eukprot:Sro53_g031640.1 shock factor protein (654) ;mRNA; r:138815-141144
MICTYRDHAAEEEVDPTVSSLQEAKLEPQGDAAEQVVFPVKLHTMLGQVEKDGLAHVVGWAPHGRCFMVRNKEEFVSRVLTTWFRQSKFASFQRQLNLYGFKRITTGQDKGGYYHELFLRGKIFLCYRIERVKIKGSKPGRVKAYADAEPDFYRMAPLPSDPTKQGALHGPGPLNPNAIQNPPPLGAQPQGAPMPIMARPPQQQQVLAFPVHAPAGATTRNNRIGAAALPEIRPIERNLSFHDFSRGDISFLSGQPQPMPLARNSPSAVRNSPQAAPGIEEQKQHSPPLDGEENVVHSPNSATRSAGSVQIFQNATNKDVDMLSGRGNYRLLPDPNAWPPASFLPGPLANSNANVGSANNNAANNLAVAANHIDAADGAHGSGAFSSVHPMLQASGRTNLVNLRGSSGGQLFPPLPSLASAGGPAQQQPPPPQENQLQQQLQQQQQQVAQQQQQQVARQQQVQQQLGQQQPAAMVLEALDLLDMPGDVLSQYLPTAESLALEDLFGASAAAAATNAAYAMGVSAPGPFQGGISNGTVPPQLLPFLSPAPPQAQQQPQPQQQVAQQAIMPGQWQQPNGTFLLLAPAQAHQLPQPPVAQQAIGMPGQWQQPNVAGGNAQQGNAETNRGAEGDSNQQQAREGGGGANQDNSNCTHQ